MGRDQKLAFEAGDPICRKEIDGGIVVRIGTGRRKGQVLVVPIKEDPAGVPLIQHVWV